MPPEDSSTATAAPPEAPATPTPAPAPAPAAAPTAPPIEEHPGYAHETIRRGDAPTEAPPPAPVAPKPEAQAPAQATPAPAQPSPAKPSIPADRKAILERLVSEELTDEEARELSKNPTIRKLVDQQANSRLGNLRQQQQQEERAAREAEENWTRLTEINDNIRRMEREETPEWKALIANPAEEAEVRAWLANYEAEKASRLRAKGGALTQEQIQQSVQEANQTWNQNAVRYFGQQAKTSLGDLYNELPADLREDFEAGKQRTDAPWHEEYLDRMAKGFRAHIQKVRTEALEAGRNEGAAGETPAPVMVAGTPPKAQLDPRQILAKHADFGFNVSAGGVTAQDLAWAKSQLGYE